MLKTKSETSPKEFHLKGCHRCGGDLRINHDMHGAYVSCVQCGIHIYALNHPQDQRAFAPAYRQRIA